VVPRYDPLTRAQDGEWTDSGAWNSIMGWRYNNRGLISAEELLLGGEIKERTYEYDARGMLTRSSDEISETLSSYGPTGLPTSMTDQAGHRAITRTGRSIRTGAGASERYDLDSSGRVASHDGLTLTWGPTGEIDEASRGGRTWSYVYDEAGQRIGKRENGAMVAGYVGSVYLASDRTIIPVKLNGRLIGTWELAAGGNHFELVATDPRGTLVADRGVSNLASPYGVRTQRPSQSAALDYVERGYDADLGTVRFGARDYDPLLGQFWSPDPLFLEDLERCSSSPVECNLYGYAGGNPINFVDPTGLDAGGAQFRTLRFETAEAIYNWTQVQNFLEGAQQYTRDHAWEDDRPTHQSFSDSLGPLTLIPIVDRAAKVIDVLDSIKDSTIFDTSGDINVQNLPIDGPGLPNLGPPGGVGGTSRLGRAGGGAKLENLSRSEARRIQNAADRTGQEISVVGSRASGTSRPESDWDYVIPNARSRTKHSLSSSLPEGERRGIDQPRHQDILEGPVNPELPHITFTPTRPKKTK
jgi:RHS repeat-associated protein